MINRFISSKDNSRGVFQNMLVLAKGSGIGKIISVLSIPVITRIYSPVDMGVLSVFIALTTIIVPVGTMLYPMALPLPKRDEMAANLAIGSLGLLLIVSLLSLLIFYFISVPLFEILSTQTLVSYWWFFSIAIFTIGFYEIVTNWAIREKQFASLSRSKINQSVLGESSKIVLGFLGVKPFGLMLGHVLAQAGGVLALMKVFYEGLKACFERINLDKIRFMLFYYKDFPVYRLPSQFLLVFAMQAPLLFSAWLYGAEVTGQLGLSIMALTLPVALFGHTTGQAYYAQVAKLGRRQPQAILQITRSVTRKLFLMSLLPFLVLLTTGPWLFEFLLGSSWRRAGVFASILSVYLLTQFVSAPLVHAFSVFNLQKEFLKINFRRVILVVGVFLLGDYINLSPETTLIIYSIVLSIHYILVTRQVFRVIHAKTDMLPEEIQSI
jgi:O-antigen/teichoic acid export membrane protein